MFFISTVVVVATDGGPLDPGTGVCGGVSEAFSNVAMLFLIGLPLARNDRLGRRDSNRPVPLCGPHSTEL